MSKGVSKQLAERIEKIPGEDGWWKRSSKDRFMKAAADLQKLGMSEDLVLDMLSDLYWASANCFGG